MEYRITLPAGMLSGQALSALLESEDSAAVADFDETTQLWRVSTSLASRELLELLQRAGCRVDPARLVIVPSVCCGGCSG